MRAVVVGNIALDESFDVTRWPAPGETLAAVASGGDLGGKGANQAVVLARCGVATRLVARIGCDAAAARLTGLLAAEPVGSACLMRTGAPTDRSVVLRTPCGENCIISATQCAQAMTCRDVDANWADADALLLQGNLAEAVTGYALQAARERGLRTVFNPSPVSPAFAALWHLVDLAVLNATEARQFTGHADPAQAARAIAGSGAGCVAVTRGGEGAILCDAHDCFAVPAARTEVRDSTGAGDTFAAVLAAALLHRGLDPRRAMVAAARAAALTVGRPGTLASFPAARELDDIFATA